MALLNCFLKRLTAVVRLLAALALLPAAANAASGDFIALCYHEVERDGAAGLTRTAVTAGDLAAGTAAAMRVVEADGFRNYGLDAFPEAGFELVWRALSLRSQPLLP